MGNHGNGFGDFGMMENKNIVALAKLIGEKTAQYTNARGGLAVGTHEVDFTVRVKGTMAVSPDTERTPTVSIPLKETLALFIRYSGITGTHAANLLKRAMTDALAANENGEQNTKGQGAIAEALPIIETTMEEVVEPMLATLPKTPAKGGVRAKLTFTEVAELVTA